MENEHLSLEFSGYYTKIIWLIWNIWIRFKYSKRGQ